MPTFTQNRIFTFRLDVKVKDEAERLFAVLGMALSGAMYIFSPSSHRGRSSVRGQAGTSDQDQACSNGGGHSPSQCFERLTVRNRR